MTRFSRLAALFSTASVLAMATSPALSDTVKPVTTDGGILTGYISNAVPAGPGYTLGLSFDGVSELDSINVNGGNFNVPPDTMGAIGATQYMETTNSAYGIYNKATGVRTSLLSGDAFWAAAGITGFGGDSRVQYDSVSQRWIVTALSGGADHNVNIAISTTSDASGPWKGVTLQGYQAGLADYPTLAVDNNAVYIGTNNFAAVNGNYNYAGTSLFVIPRTSLFAAAPSLTNTVRFDNDQFGSNGDRGFAIQGLNTTDNTGSTGGVIADSIFTNQLTHYDINNAGTAAATQTAPVDHIGPNYNAPNLARQPNGTQIVDTLDTRVGSSAFLKNGKIYTVFTVDDGTGHSAVNWEVINATTNAVISQGLISGGGYDYYQGSLAVNASGQVVLGYNRSGFQAGSGNIAFFARTFDSTAGGALVQTGTDILLHQSARGDYSNAEFGLSYDRWGDYSSVTLDPNNAQSFWAIGEYQASNLCCINGNQISSWGTWISDINLSAVPEPSSWALMLVGFGILGGAVRKRRLLEA
jgi:hypothetical protein